MTTLYQSGVLMATLDEGEWKSAEPGLVRILNALRDPDGPSGAEPDPEAAIAREAAERLGPLWTVRTADPPAFDPSVVY